MHELYDLLSDLSWIRTSHEIYIATHINNSRFILEVSPINGITLSIQQSMKNPITQSIWAPLTANGTDVSWNSKSCTKADCDMLNDLVDIIRTKISKQNANAAWDFLYKKTKSLGFQSSV